MKRKLVLTGFLGFTFLFGCNQIDKVEVSASEESEYEIVLNEKLTHSEDLTQVKHRETGCHYLYYDGVQGGGLTQMFIEKDGQTVPYCE